MIPLLLGAGGAALAGPLADQVALHLGRDGRVVDSQTVGQGYQALCDRGTGLACDWRAWDDWGVVKPDALARLADPACAAGDRDACLVLAMARPDDERAEAIVDQACAAGDVRGCREACYRAGDPLSSACVVSPPQRGTCAEGWLNACEADAVAGDVAALETLCSALHTPREDAADHTGRWCTALAAARLGSPAERKDAPADSAEVTPSGFLLGWRGATFADHALVPFDQVGSARLEVRGQRDEWLVLDLGGDALVLPAGCALVAEGVGALNQAGVSVTAHDEEGGPARSVCVELSGQNLTYVAGELEVVPAATSDGGAAREVARALNQASDPLFACARSAPRSPSSPVELAVVRAKSGPPRKASVASASGVPEYDVCVLGWVRSTSLGDSPLPAKFVVRVALDW